MGAAAAIAASAACGTSTTAPTSSATINLAADALTNPDVGMFSVPSADTSLGGGAGPWAFTPGTGQFGGPLGKANGVTSTQQVTYRDADGNIQPKFDPLTTASITTDTTATGTRGTPDGGTATINRSGEMVVTGLLGTETTRTLNGHEHGTINASLTAKDGTAITVNSIEDDTTDSLVVPATDRGAGNPRAFPLAGSRTHSDSTTTTRGTQTKSTTVVRTETYDGSGTAQVTITQDGVTRSCTVDLMTKSNTCGR
jgi:hypothetical protein